jgi:hypothetical protein
MKATEVEVGQVYVVKISGKLVNVRIDSIEHTDGQKGTLGRRTISSKTRYAATNLDSGRQVCIKSAAKLQRKVKTTPGLRNIAERTIERIGKSIEANAELPTTDFNYEEAAITYYAKLSGFTVEQIREEMYLLQNA